MKLSLSRSIMLSLAGLAVGLADSSAAGMKSGFNRLLDAVVRIDVREVNHDTGARRFASSIGSGVILSEDGLILTNAHVASPHAVEISVTLANLERVGARLVGWDHWTDLAVLRLDMADVKRRKLSFSRARFGDSARLYPGQTVYAVGTPHGLTRTVSRGIISNNNRYFEDARGVRGYETGMFNTWLQTDAAINPGNSGGPLVAEDGLVVGINSRRYLGADNLGFAIPSNIARVVMEKLEREGMIDRSYVGLVLGALQDLEVFYSLASNTGALINSVDPGSPAALAGIRAGDILISIDRQKTDGRFPEQLPPLQNLIAGKPIGSKIEFAVKRGAQDLVFAVTTEKLQSRVGEEAAFDRWGLTVRRISRTYARESQLTGDDGAIVLGVQAGFPAAVAGLERGDIITKINQQPITSLSLMREIHAQYDAQPAPMLVETTRNHRVSLYIIKP